MISPSLTELTEKITHCRQCPRLVAWREQVAKEKRAAFVNQEYWGKPVPAFGSQAARLLIVGLAPAAHGANRTGRMFTGDRSGDWLYRALHQAGFANQPQSTHRQDGLQLKEALVSAVVRCAPPANKPTTQERDACIGYLEQELALLQNCRVILALGRFAWDGVLRVLKHQGQVQLPKSKFTHAAEAEVGPYTLIGSYHPSQQNTFTGRLTMAMLDDVLERCRRLVYD